MVVGGTEVGVAVAKSFRPHPRLIGLQRVIELLEVREDPPLARGTWNSETIYRLSQNRSLFRRNSPRDQDPQSQTRYS